MHLLLSLCLIWSGALSWAAAPDAMSSPKAIAVKQSPADEARTLFYIQRAEKIWLYEETGEWTRVKAKNRGKWVTGYVQTIELHAEPEPEPPRKRHYGLGFGMTYSNLSQNGKSFQTDDEVTYSLSSYSSSSSWPYLVAQFGQEDFWRVRLGYRIVNFKGSAHTDVGSSVYKVEVGSRMASMAVDKAWTLTRWPSVYFGAGAEFDKGMDISVKLDGSTLPTSSSDLQSYYGVVGFVGWQAHLLEIFSVLVEGRADVFMSQSAPIYGFEASAAGLFWF